MMARPALGWHGKLPSLGDFASRRLEAEFIEPWDRWISAGLLALREAQPQDWLPAYLGSPSWRFLLMPGVLPGAASRQAWAGVLMPSVDRVGRYFPLTLVQALGKGPTSSQQMMELWFWLARLDDLARDALHEDWTAAQLDQELLQMALPDLAALHPAPPPLPPAPGAWVAAGGQASEHIGGLAQQLWAAQCQGCAWWQASPDEAAHRLWISRGLPISLVPLFGATATM